MPLIRVDVIAGRTPEQLSLLLDQIHRAVVEAFAVPERDRYQIVQSHAPGAVVLQDTGLGFERTDQAVVVQVTTRRRPEAAKREFYRLLAQRLAEHCDLAGTDLLVTLVENGDADWSFADGSPQFLTGALT